MAERDETPVTDRTPCSCEGRGDASVIAQREIGLPPGHPLHTFVAEHAMLHEFLDELVKLAALVHRARTMDEALAALPRLSSVAKHLGESSRHYEREERVLFPHLELRGIVGAPYALRLEHEQIRARTEELVRLVATHGEHDLVSFRRELRRLRNELVPLVRDHIRRENETLFPLALEAIDERLWPVMKAECDGLGYCCFSPEEAPR